MHPEEHSGTEDWNEEPMYASLWPPLAFGRTGVDENPEPAPTRDLVYLNVHLVRTKRGRRPHMQLNLFGYTLFAGWHYE